MRVPPKRGLDERVVASRWTISWTFFGFPMFTLLFVGGVVVLLLAANCCSPGSRLRRL